MFADQPRTQGWPAGVGKMHVLAAHRMPVILLNKMQVLTVSICEPVFTAHTGG